MSPIRKPMFSGRRKFTEKFDQNKIYYSKGKFKLLPGALDSKYETGFDGS